MRSFEIFVAPVPSEAPVAMSRADDNPRSWLRTSDGRDPRVAVPLRRGREGCGVVLDIFIGGANVTALVTAAHRGGPGRPEPTAASVGGVLRDLAAALRDLDAVSYAKRIVRFYDDPWELCVERWGADACLSVYRGGTAPVVAVYDRVVPFAEVKASAMEAVESLLLRRELPAALAVELRELAGILAADRRDEEAPEGAHGPPSVPPVSLVTVPGDDGAHVAFACDVALRSGTRVDEERDDQPTLERTDMHALLFRGRVSARVREHGVDLGEVHPFLVAERLIDVARRLFDAWERGAAYHVREESGGACIGARLCTDGTVALTLGGGSARARREDALHTFPALRVRDVAEASIAFGRKLVRALLRVDRAQASNLRLSAFRRQLRELEGALREACRDDSRTNPAPESYRAFAVPRDGMSRTGTDAGRPTRPLVEPPTRLRYAARWRAVVPGIDLRSTFLCGDRLIVGGLGETFGLDRATGEVLWRAETEKATSVVTPGGVARLHADGELSLHDFGTGEVVLRSWLAPRVGGPPAGAVVNLPGLPRLLIVTEGERHLVAIDLTNGEPRWRFAWGAKGALRLKRAGKLLYYACGDSALTALDVLTGRVVWRVRDRLRFRAPPTLDHDLLFAVAGGDGSRAVVHAIDAFSGQSRWVAELAGERGTCTVEGNPHVAADVVLSAVRTPQGVRLIAHDRDRGTPRWASSHAVAPSGTSWLVVDDLLIGNAPTGEIFAIDAATGELRYKHLLGTVLETDVPRRLEPVLRSGALFVPHANVHVFRPRDGAEIGVIGPCEAIPDMLRVDERCDVFIAEESGHLVSFAAGPRLSLVRS
jgi:outer membrane protein assembly factor BamB